MKVVRGYPPNITEIRARLSPGRNTVFAYGDVVYSPSGHPLPPDLLEHELVHAAQQRREGGPEAWWRRYLDDPEFRLTQEAAAYQAQYRAVGVLPRSERRRLLARFCRDLASPMYGRLVTVEQARALIVA